MKRFSYPVLIEGLPFIIFSLSITVISAILKSMGLSATFAGLTLFMLIFFRNPKRIPPADKNAIVSPADGRIIEIGEVFEEKYMRERVIKISIFMNIFNVHVNRAPFHGKILLTEYSKGRFHSAMAKKASEENERNVILMEIEGGKRLLLVQIAGILARRIRCYTKKGDILFKGEPYGAILFGSRVELFLPLDVKIERRKGEWVKGGETVIGYLP